MLLMIALTALVERWLETPPTVNAAPSVAPTEATALMPFGYGAAVAEHDWNTATRRGDFYIVCLLEAI